MPRPYEIFSGEELKIAELIQRRRLQMIVHSYIYYEMDRNVISDFQWAGWAKELAELQAKYPDIEKQVPYREGFEDWDGSTGAFLPLKEEWIMRKAQHILMMYNLSKPVEKKPPTKKQQKLGRKSLF